MGVCTFWRGDLFLKYLRETDQLLLANQRLQACDSELQVDTDAGEAPDHPLATGLGRVQPGGKVHRGRSRLWIVYAALSATRGNDLAGHGPSILRLKITARIFEIS